VGAALADRLQVRGWRITPQRRAVIAALDGEHVHLSAEQVLGAARRILPEVSLATVYNTLNELVSMGEISEIRLLDGTTRYDPKVGPDHHHLVCEGCGLTFDVQPRGVDGLSLPRVQRYGMTVDSDAAATALSTDDLGEPLIRRGPDLVTPRCGAPMCGAPMCGAPMWVAGRSGIGGGQPQ
jgi:Fur family ferric uptake transcriptional regulator